MAGRAKRAGWVCAWAAGWFLAMGCSRHQDASAPGAGPNSPGAAATGEAVATSAEAPPDPRMEQSFADATLTEPPVGDLPPPEATLAGKSVGKLYSQVVKVWDTVRFASAGGKRLAYKAVLDTEMGTIEIALRPDMAPNHVRSFVALAKAGYFDGLVFERTVHEEGPDAKLELIEAGCPLGTGELGYGSIGYWLKPEFSPQALHEEGTVGAFHGDDGDTSTCKFYITLSPAPFMDEHYTVFGKVTQGLDVARKILSMPIRNDTPEGDRPLKPVVIRAVTIQVAEVEKAGPS